MRKLIKPALPTARIFNPEHNRFLPPDGMELEQSPYWLGLERRGDVIAVDLVDSAATSFDTSAPAAPAA